MTIPLNIGGSDGLDIQTRVVLKNETRHEVLRPGMSGKVTLIGAFPSADDEIRAVTSYAEYLSVYGITNPKQAEQYDAHRAIQRLFMEGIEGEMGATSVTCINITSEFTQTNSLNVESQQDLTSKIEELSTQLQDYRQRLNNARLQRDTFQATKEQLEVTINTLSAIDNPTAQEEEELADARTAYDQADVGYQDALGSITTYTNLIREAEELLTKYNSFSGYLTQENDTIKINPATLLTFEKFKTALKKIADEDTDMLFISSDLHDCVIGGNSGTPNTEYDTSQAPNLGVVYDTLIDFIDNEYTNHRPLTYVGHIRTASTENNNTLTGIPSEYIEIDSGRTPNTDFKDTDYNVSYGDEKWGAKQIATLFTRENNELCTAGLFYQGGIINGKKVGSMELAAHICGWLAGRNVGEDLTYQTIPGLTSINEEVFFQKGDAGTLLNNYGIQIIRPKDRLAKTFYINNSIMPTGWHTNHVRSVIYLLKKYEFEAGLGINNIITNIEAFRTSLENVSKEVMKEVDVIRSVTLGDIEVINNYHIYIPVDIILAGVVTKISVGVSMAIDEEGTAGSTLTTTGYNFYYQEA